MEAEYKGIIELRYQSLVSSLREYNRKAPDEKRLLDAFEFALSAHSGQKRKSGEPYIIHPMEVALIIARLNLDLDSVIAALLHDVIEDTPHTFADLKKRFGPAVAELVDGVTKLTRAGASYTSPEEKQMEDLRKMFMAMAKDIRVILVKIADRLHNMRTISYLSDRKRREISLETMEIYAPLAHRLGMQRIKWELEDTAFQQLDPVGYDEIARDMEVLRHTHTTFLQQTRDQIDARLTEAGIKDALIESRIKHVYSLYRKMMGQNKTLAEIHDLYAVRIIVEQQPDCYAVLGQMHDLYKPVPGRVKDYISMPKPNLYQSLHTTVIGREGQPFEIQIRTLEMHRQAEDGIAAHWRYKIGAEGTARTQYDQNLAWVRSLLESQQDTEADEFIHGIKHHMFSDEVYVFTPKGDVVSLPAGAGPVDFAYGIHSAVGNKLSGAKVNGRIVPLDYKLRNGDRVEILTGNAQGPSRDWMKLVKTSEARNKIKQWFKKERREENIQQGREELERELKRAGLDMAVLQQADAAKAALKKLSFAAIDDMLAAVGYGGLSVRRVVSRFKEEAARHTRPAVTDETVAEQVAAAQAGRKPKKAVSGVIVEGGLDNCLIKFARCCAPVPGDPIDGYVTRGFGVSVHRGDCPNLLESLNADRGRHVRVSWARDIRDSYESSLAIHCRDRQGLVVDVMTALSGCKVKVSHLNARTVDGHSLLVTLRMEVTGLEQLTDIINRVAQIPSVVEIQRKDAV